MLDAVEEGGGEVRMQDIVAGFIGGQLVARRRAQRTPYVPRRDLPDPIAEARERRRVEDRDEQVALAATASICHSTIAAIAEYATGPAIWEVHALLMTVLTPRLGWRVEERDETGLRYGLRDDDASLLELVLHKDCTVRFGMYAPLVARLDHASLAALARLRPKTDDDGWQIGLSGPADAAGLVPTIETAIMPALARLAGRPLIDYNVAQCLAALGTPETALSLSRLHAGIAHLYHPVACGGGIVYGFPHGGRYRPDAWLERTATGSVVFRVASQVLTLDRHTWAIARAEYGLRCVEPGIIAVTPDLDADRLIAFFLHVVVGVDEEGEPIEEGDEPDADA